MAYAYLVSRHAYLGREKTRTLDSQVDEIGWTS